MGCCGNHNHGGHRKDEHGLHGGRKHHSHKWLMLLCCVLPIALIAILFLTNAVSGAAGKSLPYLLLLICPLSHLVIMPFMMKRKKNRHL